ncbi:amidohydrolase family protein [Clostridium aminobutyricum]|uniref:Amidohydrolase family protein n=1 Tax=Clostridium aminobutyricum TaxID=33953 RepID=A0A939II38_CLOAM|nr:amidohydrolase family protein [Clostridium aminobutyricum]MBN7774522.1 amidohydrolase family protein [Clostridium aminobutyricum]
MIFGLFKKDENADLVFVNGRVYTQNPDFPWAEAIACKGSKIIYVGSRTDAESIVGSETCVIDMKGGFMFPGLIHTHSHPALRVFEDIYIPFSEGLDLEEVQGVLTDYILEHPDRESYFGYGFAGHLLDSMSEEEAKQLLDELYNEKPVVVLSSGEEKLWLNSCAFEAVRAAAQADGVAMITTSYLMHVVAPIEYDEILKKVASTVTAYCEKGFTSIFNAGAPEFMNEVYQQVLAAMYQQGVLKQRNFDSFQVVRDVVPERVIQRLMQKRTNATEMDGFINCEVLKLILKSDAEKYLISPSVLKQLMRQASDRNFNIHVDAEGKMAFQECMKAISETRNAGYRKNSFTVACEPEVYTSDGEFHLEDMHCDNVFFQVPTLCEPNFEYAALEGAKNVEEIIDRLTIDAAIALGINDKLGSIERGKLADLVIFDENPFELIEPGLFKRLSASMTVLNGEVVYDAEEENLQEWYDLMAAQQL